MSLQKRILSRLPQWWHRRRRNALRRPERLRKWYRWEAISGKNIRIFYVPSSANVEEVVQIAYGCDETLQRVTALLGVGPIKRPLTVYLYPDTDSFRRCEQIQGMPFAAISRNGVVSLPYSPWRQIARDMAHELTHAVNNQLIIKNAIFLLNEGLAVYVDSKLYPMQELPPVPCLNVSLQALSNYPSFWACLVNPDTCLTIRHHVHSFALYLIHRGGMDSFVKVIRGATHRIVERWEKQFTAAVRKTYGLDLIELEQQWRQDSAITRDGKMLCWDWVVPTARTAIRTAQERAQHLRSKTVEAEHLLWAFLHNPNCIAFCLILQAAPAKEILQSIEHLPVHKTSEEEEQPHWGETTRQCVALAIDEARSLNCTYIGTEHLVLGMLSQKTNLGYLILSDFGLELERLRAAATSYYSTTTLHDRTR